MEAVHAEVMLCEGRTPDEKELITLRIHRAVTRRPLKL